MKILVDQHVCTVRDVHCLFNLSNDYVLCLGRSMVATGNTSIMVSPPIEANGLSCITFQWILRQPLKHNDDDVLLIDVTNKVS